MDKNWKFNTVCHAHNIRKLPKIYHLNFHAKMAKIVAFKKIWFLAQEFILLALFWNETFWGIFKQCVCHGIWMIVVALGWPLEETKLGSVLVTGINQACHRNHVSVITFSKKIKVVYSNKVDEIWINWFFFFAPKLYFTFFSFNFRAFYSILS